MTMYTGGYFFRGHSVVTAFIHYFPTSKLLILSSATLEQALICLTAVINCTNSHLSTDVSFATAIDVLICGTYMLFDLIWCIIFYPHNWMAFVRLNKRHVMLCYVMSNTRQQCAKLSWRYRRVTSLWHQRPWLRYVPYIADILLRHSSVTESLISLYERHQSALVTGERIISDAVVP